MKTKKVKVNKPFMILLNVLSILMAVLVIARFEKNYSNQDAQILWYLGLILCILSLIMKFGIQGFRRFILGNDKATKDILLWEYFFSFMILFLLLGFSFYVRGSFLEYFISVFLIITGLGIFLFGMSFIFSLFLGEFSKNKHIV